jgi:hypothetical protein
MISWEGRFSWQGYALTGRPDFLNYLNAGDVTWEELWSFYRTEAAPPGAIRALSRLFHLFLSRQYDTAGCWLDPEGEIHSRLRAWAEFTLEMQARVPLFDFQADLAGLVGAGMVTPLYYQAAYLVFMETSVDQLAEIYSCQAAHGSTGDDDELPDPTRRLLPVYHPGPARFPHLLSDARWDARLRSHVASGYRSWNSAYTAHLPDRDEEEAWMMVGGEA